MADNYVGNVLQLLRLIRSTEGLGPGNSGLQYLQLWAGADGPSTLARLAAYALDQTTGARALIEGSKLSDEAKAGLVETIGGVTNMFSPATWGSPRKGCLPALDAAISQFAILASATGADAPDRPAEIDELIEQVESVKALFENAGLDPIVRGTAVRHIAALLTLLRNIGPFGVDGAISAYLELVIRLKRAETASSPETKSKLGALWSKVEKWSGSLAKIDEAVNAGGSLLSHFKSAPDLLQHLPRLLG